ncbi:hypothetical protein AB0I28_04215 [Phytomonospora sp. NPDC050363]|uniref:hypothetical protein n=1 Tax=Phytomonospora sp. NPDC050363 TaxID=3155642 RepID=UPI0033D1B97C
MKTDILCKHCGAIVPQRAGRGRPRQYCPEGTCQGAAKRDRDLRRAAPGLEGALARAEDLYDRMESGLAQAIEPLARVLADEMSPAGVEAKISAVTAEAAAQVATAKTDREDAFRRLRDAQAEATRLAREHAEELSTLRAELDAARSAAGTAADQAQRATSEREAAEQQAELAEARAAEAETAAARDRELAAVAARERDEAVSAADLAETARAAAARAVVAAQTERDMAATAAERAATRADEAVGQAAAARQDAERARTALAEAEESRQHEAEESRAAHQRELDAARSAADARVAEAEAEAGRARTEVAGHLRRAQQLEDRLDDHRERLEVAKVEAAALLERAVTAELRERAATAALEAAGDDGK